ncbi:hypothetical protein PtA15_8A202 [Puccinia triticina]|uniref:HAT C-terminal dimerisation domain-containing protein n=1 Tax=Puccinia triticina TaxID=208348 RepID=A0ABY7CSH4_9BASI|nr:uncharacterized protein PtA15_8A202 [Puccinia triticina]WAQ87298.1 hypothetical protein PtA15_8A202 [Puccinia triticina]
MEGHYFKAYELSKTEWKDVNDLNQVLKITQLIQSKFDDQVAHLKSVEPEPSHPKDSQSHQTSPTKSDSDGEDFNFYPENPESVEANSEIQRYIKGDFPLDKRGCVLSWWKAES